MLNLWLKALLRLFLTYRRGVEEPEGFESENGAKQRDRDSSLL